MLLGKKKKSFILPTISQVGVINNCTAGSQSSLVGALSILGVMEHKLLKCSNTIYSRPESS